MKWFSNYGRSRAAINARCVIAAAAVACYFAARQLCEKHFPLIFPPRWVCARSLGMWEALGVLRCVLSGKGNFAQSFP
jgi:hypothetical protein